MMIVLARIYGLVMIPWAYGIARKQMIVQQMFYIQMGIYKPLTGS